MTKRVLITGGAGFVGSSLTKIFLKNHSDYQITVLDNLKRRGSEINLPVFNELGVEFVHGDIRNRSDFDELKNDYDLFIEASAEPSVHSGIDGGLDYLIDSNLGGTLNCLNFAKKKCDKMIFLSTSRVYSIEALKNIKLETSGDRFVTSDDNQLVGISKGGIQENFDVLNYRSFYGATKFCSEVFIQEYARNLGVKALINRCGVIAGPGQFGKVDQGVFTLWVANHYFKKPLKYFGFGGRGLQVRDLLHPEDLYHLVQKQFSSEKWEAQIYNVGGGLKSSTSLKEYTQLCEEVTGNQVKIESIQETADVDIPYYVTNFDKAKNDFEWEPMKNSKDIVVDINNWIKSNESFLKDIF